MILYSRSGDFLGIGKDELSFLGYEDLDEFKSIHSDVADLFVNRPGYIFKFKNFSWIDYALHSGAPKKSVIIKLKTGNEVEVAIKIKELFLYNPKENEELYYSIEFVTSMSQGNSLQNDSSFIQSAPAPQVPFSTNKTPHTEKVIQEQKVEPPKEISLEEDFVQNHTENLSVNFDTDEIEPSPKLKMDDTVFEQVDEVQPALDTSDDFIKDYEAKEIPKLKIDIAPEEDSFEPVIDIASDYMEIPTLEIPNSTDFNSDPITQDKQTEDIVFDLVTCVEKLGLDISLVGELITDYMDKIEENTPDMKTSIENEDTLLLKNKIYELKGISDNLNMTQISNRLINILEASDIEAKMKELEKFEKFIEKFKSELV